jgi:hypothetical protein
MKRAWKKLLIFGCSLVCLFTTALSSLVSAAAESPAVFGNKNEAATYISGVSYAGEYVPSRLYYRTPRSAAWRRMSHADNYRDVVTCQAALVSLGKTGNWQGHLKQDGSCGSLDEPSFFALGNRINFDISLDQDVSSN